MNKLVVFVGTLSITLSVAFAFDTNSGWRSEVKAALRRCTQAFPNDLQLQQGCMENEENAFVKMKAYHQMENQEEKTKPASKIFDIKEIVSESNAKYKELCSKISRRECLTLAQQTENKEVKKQLAMQVCIRGSLEAIESCGLFAFLEDNPEVYKAIVKIACEKGNKQSCFQYATMLQGEDQPKEDQIKSKKIFDDLCKSRNKELCRKPN